MKKLVVQTDTLNDEVKNPEGGTYFENLDQLKYRMDVIFERQKTEREIRRLFSEFHSNLAKILNEKNLQWWARAHSYGVTYFCDSKKAFIFCDIRSNHFGIEYYTGNSSIEGIEKSTWVTRKDMKGSKPIWIDNNSLVKKVLIHAEDAYRIAVDESPFSPAN